MTVMPDQSAAELKYLVQRQREEIRTLNELGKLLSLANDPQDVVRAVASYLMRTFPLAMCAVLLVESRTLQVIQFATIAQVDFTSAMRELCTKAGEQLPQPLTEAQLTHTVEHHSALPGQGASGPISYLRSSQFVPLRFNGQVIGWLALFSGKAEAFPKEETRVLEIVADQLGAALRNAVLLDQLRRADELKRELLLVISHELRIPLTSIKEGISLVLEGSLGPTTADQQEFLKTVDDNAQRLDTLVEKVVVTTQLISGQLPYTMQEIDLAETAKELEAAFGARAQEKGLTLTFNNLHTPLKLTADPKRLTQALTELLANAVQATDGGGIVTVDAAPASNGVELRIRDTGCGIPAEELPRLFESFRLIGGVDDRKTGGLGLGLFIAKSILDAHHGTIEVKSEVGHGTELVVRLPTTR